MCPNGRPRCCGTGTPAASTSAWERLGRTDEEIGESPTAHSAGYGWKCLRPNARRSSKSVTRTYRRRSAARNAARARSRRGDPQSEVAVSIESAAKPPHCVDERREGPVRGGEVIVGDSRQRLTGVFGQRREEPPCDVHSVVCDPQDDLAAVGRVGFTAEVVRRDHSFDEIGDGRAGHAHPLTQLPRRQR